MTHDPGHPSPPPVRVPPRVLATCRTLSNGPNWLAGLPHAVAELRRRWRLSLGPPFGMPAAGSADGTDDAAGTPSGPLTFGSCAWVAPATDPGGQRLVLKLGVPHMEAEHEIAALRLYGGDGAVRLVDADERLHALLLERCDPGSPLTDLPVDDQDVVLAGLLRRLWREPPPGHPFRPLHVMTRSWAESALRAGLGGEPELAREGLRLYAQLSRDPVPPAVLATDLHAGNVLRAQREPWLAIDPKPFVGDPCYDATQHLLNGPERLVRDPYATIGRFADLLGIDADRVRLWTFARVAVGPPGGDAATASRLARSLAPT